MSKSAIEIAKAARLAFEASQAVSSEERSNALLAVRAELERQKEVVLEANKQDMDVRWILMNTCSILMPLMYRPPKSRSMRGPCRPPLSSDWIYPLVKNGTLCSKGLRM